MTWPPGDARGHWSPLFDFYGHLVWDGCRLNMPDPVTVEYAAAQAREPEKVLTPMEVEVVE